MHGFEIARFIRRIDSEYRPHISIMTASYKNVRYQNEARLKYGIDDCSSRCRRRRSLRCSMPARWAPFGR